MAISDKLNYLIETKSQLKDMINYGLPTENQITNETTFRNYVKGIFEAFLESLRDSTTLYTNLPKISGNGTQITLNDTANAPMRITLGSSALSQDGTPTPDSPQDIHTISGDNSVVVCGKNFISIPSNCVVTGGPNIIDLETPIPIGTYIVSIDSFINGGTNRGLIHFLNNNTQIAYALLDNSNKTRTISITSPITKLRLYSQNNVSASIGITSTFVNMMVSKNGGDYEPYVSQTAQVNLGNIEYCKIGNYEDEFIHNKGKNEIPFQDGEVTLNGITISVSGGIVKLNGTATATSVFKLTNGVTPISGFYIDNNWLNENVITNKNNNTFSINYVSGSGDTSGCAFRTYADTTTYLNQYYPTKTSQSTTYTTDGKISCIVFFFNSGASFDNYTFTLQLEKGTSVTDFEPTNDKWYLKKNIGKVVLDGSESDWALTTGTNRYSYWFRNYTIGALTQKHKKYCDKFIYTSASYLDAPIPSLCENTATDNYTNFMFIFNTDGTQGTTIANWKTWLSSNNVTCYYIMDTPTYTQITGTLETQLNNIYKNMLSYKGTTNVSQINNDLPFVLGVSAIQDLE